MKEKFTKGSDKKGYSKAADDLVCSSARRISAVNQTFSSVVSATASSFAIHSLTLA